MATQKRATSQGLQAHYARSSERSVLTVRSAIRALQDSGRKVTLDGIVKHASGTISQTTILRNPSCRALYEVATASTLSTRVRQRRGARFVCADKREASRAQYLRRKTKEDLIKLLIQAERELRAEREHTANLREKLLSGLLPGKGKS